MVSVIKHWVLCPHSSHDVTFNLLSISLFIFVRPGCQWGNMQQCLLTSEYLLSETAAAQDYFLVISLIYITASGRVKRQRQIQEEQ